MIARELGSTVEQADLVGADTTSLTDKAQDRSGDAQPSEELTTLLPEANPSSASTSEARPRPAVIEIPPERL